MASFRALLVGVAEYDDPAVQALPFVVDGLSSVGAALESRGYTLGVDDGPGSGRVTRTQMLTRVQHFLQDARHGETLLIFLSGHGAHSGDVDYLVPSDASLSWPQLADVCVALNAWARQIENTSADGVIFLIDACREGFDEHVMAGIGRAGWSDGKGLNVARRNVAYVFACPPGQRARYVVGDEGFSLFARAVERTAADPEGPSTLAEFRLALEETMKELAATYEKPAQEIRVRTECDQDMFVVLPPGKPTADRESWRRLASEHPAWECVHEEHDQEKVRALTNRLIEQLAIARQEATRHLAEDPWRDMGLARRISEQVGFLLTRLLDRPTLSSAEAGLLVAIPFIYETHWVTQAAYMKTVSPADLLVHAAATTDRSSFERFAHGYQRLIRRATAHADTSSEGIGHIGWWLFHRWLTRRPESYIPEAYERLIAPSSSDDYLAADLFSGLRISELIRSLGADPGFLTRTDRPGALRNRNTIAPGTPSEQTVRERLIGYILAVAHYLAIEPICLPEIIADHLGIGDPVSPAEVRSTADAARWEPRGHTRVLNAPCRHPAVEVALRRHANDLDVLLGHAHRLAADEADLTLLTGMPVHATADLVGQAQLSEGPVYTSAGVRFRLAEDRIQELLMGEQLYGDRSLAIRELYQNALDACRYRQARTEYLQRSKQISSSWQGQVYFEQGIDENGRPYLDCVDNGIGMGVRELADVFAQAGTRFADLPEFLEEQAEWARLDPPVRLQPNSRFGIGVLSYFMLADEITIVTCRLGRDGRPAQRLQVSIAGPGNLFRIRDIGPGNDAGTTIRLHLRPDQGIPLPTKVLHEILWVAEYDLRVRDTSGTLAWSAGDLATHAPVGDREFYSTDPDDSDDESPNRDPIRFAKVIVHGANQHVWWCDTFGMILTDGLTSDRQIFGAVVDLTGDIVPPLSVDRRNILNYKITDVECLLEDAVPSLMASGKNLPTFEWLCKLADDAPMVADLITQSAIEADRLWKIDEIILHSRAAGCCSLDTLLLSRTDIVTPRGPESTRLATLIPDWLAAWRATACGITIDAAPFAALESSEVLEVVPAMPSDLLLMSRDLDAMPKWLDPAELVPVGHIVRAAVRLRRRPALVAERLAALGFVTPDVSAAPEDLTGDDVFLVSRHLDGRPGWLDAAEPVPVGYIMRAAVRLRRRPALVAERLAALGFVMRDVSGAPEDLTDDDTLLMSRDLDGGPGWLDPAEPVPVGHIMRAAVRLRRRPALVAERLAALGFVMRDVSSAPEDLTDDDTLLMSRDLDGEPGWLDAAEPVPVGHIMRAAMQLRRRPALVAERLAALGFVTPDVSGAPEDLTGDDTLLMTRNLDGRTTFWRRGWLDAAEPVPVGHIMRAAVQLRRRPALVAERLTALGFVTPDVSGAPEDLTDDDVQMVSRDLNGRPGWLDPAEPVPVGHIMRAAVRLRRRPALVAERLAALGFVTPDVSGAPEDLTDDDTLLMRNAPPDRQAWLDAAEPVPVGHIMRAAVQLRRRPALVAERLAALGFVTPDVSGAPEDLTDDDTFLMSRNLDEKQPELRTAIRWLDPTASVPLSFVIRAAVRLRRQPADVAGRLAALGYSVPDLQGLLPRSQPGGR